MSQIKATNTFPEISLRRYLHSIGIRYRTYYPIKGKPDIAFPRIKSVVFVHGCFWHSHGCNNSSTPKSNTAFWKEKIEGNLERDRRVQDYLKNEGWRFLITWECEIERDIESVGRKIKSFINLK